MSKAQELEQRMELKRGPRNTEAAQAGWSGSRCCDTAARPPGGRRKSASYLQEADDLLCGDKVFP